ncbi:MAG: hypothetical protein AAFP03_00605 [Cyanobacteria bacterium J06598_3]
MTSEHSIWKKFAYYWLSPLLLVSLGLHGVGLLIPMPDLTPEALEDPEVELPDPIQVTELPLKLEPEPEPEPEPVFIPPPPPVVIPPPVTPPPVVEAAPPPVVEPLPPEPDPLPELEPAPELEPVPDSNGQKPLKTPSTPQNYVAGRARDATNASLLFGSKYGNGDPVGTPLAITFLADEGICYDKGPTIDIPVLVAVDNQGYLVVEGKDENGEDKYAITIVQTSGYADIDAWLRESLAYELPEETFDELPDLDNGDIAAWINEVHGRPNQQPLVPAGDDNAPYAFTVRVNIEGEPCEASQSG